MVHATHYRERQQDYRQGRRQNHQRIHRTRRRGKLVGRNVRASGPRSEREGLIQGHHGKSVARLAPAFMIHFRLMTGNDIPAGLSLCRAAGWNQTADDWLHFLALSPDGCWVALHDEIGIVGTVATLPYEDRFRWIG